MNLNKKINGLKGLFFVSACVLMSTTVSIAQNSAAGSGPAQQTVKLRPVDTGRSVVTFNIGGVKKPRYDSHLAIKSNLLYAVAALSPNLALEIGTSAHTSIEVLAGYNGWGNLWDHSDSGPDYDLDNHYKRRLNHVFGKAEFRYWLKGRFDGHFFGAGVFFADYHAGDLEIPLLFEREYDYDGVAYGGTLSWGYSWRFHRYWALEFGLGFGVAVFEYNKSLIEADSTGFNLVDLSRFRKTYFGPTNASVKIVFVIR